MITIWKIGFDYYLYKFQELANQCDMCKDDFLLMFSNGLKQRAKFEVKVREPNTLIEAYTIASILWAMHR